MLNGILSETKWISLGVVEFEWVQTNEMVADGLTRTLANEKFAFFVRQIRLYTSV